MMFEDRHLDSCNVWVGRQQCDGPDESLICTCGFRAWRLARVAQTRDIPPLGMGEDEFLRTLGIDPRSKP